jgi:hypothetical protein
MEGGSDAEDAIDNDVIWKKAVSRISAIERRPSGKYRKNKRPFFLNP